jgi:hypothetical protein
VSYKEWRDTDGYSTKEWRNEAYELHREDGPAYIKFYPNGARYFEVFFFNGKRHRDSGPAHIRYNSDESISWESFHFYAENLGFDEEGFWALWDKLTEDQRKAPAILACLTRFS